DVDFFEVVAFVGRDWGERIEVAGVGQLVDIDDFIIRGGNHPPNDRGPNKTGAPRHKNPHAAPSQSIENEAILPLTPELSQSPVWVKTNRRGSLVKLYAR